MISIKNLTVVYDKIPVIENLDLEIMPGQIHGLIGLNGSGKTTLLNTIYGFVKQTRGSVQWMNQGISKKHIAFLESQNFFYSKITGREYLLLFPVQNESFDLDVWKELMQLPLDDLIENYSSGMKKKLALLGFLKLDKPIILLDEPFNGVDIETSRIISLLLQKLKSKNKTIIVTSHILETLTQMGDCVHHLENKKINRTYKKEDLDKIDTEIFSNFEKRTKDLIDKAI